MKKDSILFILKNYGLEDSELELFTEKLKNKDFTLDSCDKLLVSMGYEKIFTAQEDEGDEDMYDFDNFQQIRRKVEEQY
jgi:hypothetical protein